MKKLRMLFLAALLLTGCSTAPAPKTDAELEKGAACQVCRRFSLPVRRIVAGKRRPLHPTRGDGRPGTVQDARPGEDGGKVPYDMRGQRRPCRGFSCTPRGHDVRTGGDT